MVLPGRRGPSDKAAIFDLDGRDGNGAVLGGVIWISKSFLLLSGFAFDGKRLFGGRADSGENS